MAGIGITLIVKHSVVRTTAKVNAPLIQVIERVVGTNGIVIRVGNIDANIWVGVSGVRADIIVVGVS